MERDKSSEAIDTDMEGSTTPLPILYNDMGRLLWTLVAPIGFGIIASLLGGRTLAGIENNCNGMSGPGQGLMEEWKSKSEAQDKKRAWARAIWDEFYKGLDEMSFWDDPEPMAFEIYRRTVRKNGRAVVIWESDTPEDVLRKIDDVRTGKIPPQMFDEKMEKVMETTLKKAKEVCPKPIHRHYAVMELYLQVRTYEHRTATRKGFVVFENSDDASISERCKKLFKKSYDELSGKPEQKSVMENARDILYSKSGA
jgi:hypothetical protein